MVLSRITRTPAPATRAEQRRALIAWRAALVGSERAIAEAAIAKRLHAALESFSAETVIGVYWPIRGEPALPTLACDDFWGRRTLALPRVVARERPLEFGRWSAGCEWSFDRWGIATPNPFEAIEPDLLLIPCVGFDHRGYRLGYGGGFYDRTLAARSFATIGIAFDGAEMVDFVEHAHDRPLDLIVTEQRLLRGSQADARSRS